MEAEASISTIQRSRSRKNQVTRVIDRCSCNTSHACQLHKHIANSNCVSTVGDVNVSVTCVLENRELTSSSCSTNDNTIHDRRNFLSKRVISRSKGGNTFAINGSSSCYGSCIDNDGLRKGRVARIKEVQEINALLVVRNLLEGCVERRTRACKRCIGSGSSCTQADGEDVCICATSHDVIAKTTGDIVFTRTTNNRVVTSFTNDSKCFGQRRSIDGSIRSCNGAQVHSNIARHIDSAICIDSNRCSSGAGSTASWCGACCATGDSNCRNVSRRILCDNDIHSFKRCCLNSIASITTRCARRTNTTSATSHSCRLKCQSYGVRSIVKFGGEHNRITAVTTVIASV